jgi:hypothetical protein
MLTDAVQALIGIRMQNAGDRNPPIQQWVEAIHDSARVFEGADREPG